MKKSLVALMVALVVAMSSSVWAKMGGNYSYCQLICSGEPVTISGIVVDIQRGNGYLIDTGNGVVTVYGFGPTWFWKNLGVDKPAIGDDVTVEAYKVTFNSGIERIIATSVTVDGQSVELRDPETCIPLWIKTK